MNGNIETGGDRDWFAVELEGGTHYRIDLEGSSTLHGRISEIYRVVDGSLSPVRKTREVETGEGEIIPGVTDGGDATVWIRAPADGTYYIAASSGHTGYGAYGGTYEVSVEEVL